ncbi:HD domain-containing protein [Halalkalibacillus halophilus]|uniref:HD domain-containing protein n=1 Tax=Halalkalibacillus halophilus TaxID=392827 RepID=UPI00040348BD|nr:HD domain-containing protein [Halalkalibacillus halophilus]
MEQEEIVNSTKKFVRNKLENEGTGHDWWHIERVTQMAQHICKVESANYFMTTMGALLHDLIDDKIVDSTEVASQQVELYLREHDISLSDIEAILSIIHSISFRKGMIPETLEGKIVQDADRLDAIGAIGIARTFMYAGSKGHIIHHPEQEDSSSAITHFYEKLLTLKDSMHTDEARRIAEKRHAYMEDFLSEFYAEWEGKPNKG